MAEQKTPQDKNMSAITGKRVSSDNSIVNVANFLQDIVDPFGSSTFLVGEQKTPQDKNMSAITGKLVASDDSIVNVADFIQDVTDPESGVNVNVRATAAGAAGINVNVVEIIPNWESSALTTYQLKKNTGLIALAPTLQTLTLPTDADVGDCIAVVGFGSGLFRISQNADDQILFCSKSTTVGETGYISSTSTRDVIYLILAASDTINYWVATGSSAGNYTIDGDLTDYINSLNNSMGEITIRNTATITSISDSASATLSTQLMTANAVQVAIANAVMGLAGYRGFWDASSNTFPSTGGTGAGGAIEAGNFWRISVAGTLGTEPVEPGDLIFATIDDPGQTQNNWAIVSPRVTTVFGRTGDITAQTNDYNFTQIGGTASTTQGGTGLTSSGASGNVLTSNGTEWQSVAKSYGHIWWSTGSWAGESFSFTAAYQELSAIGSTIFTLASPFSDFSMSTDGRLQYTGSTTKTFLVNTFFVPVIDPIGFATQLYKNGVAVAGTQIYVENGISGATLLGYPLSLATNDYISLWAKRNGASSNEILHISISCLSI